jgi:WD40 repeat protein
MHPNGYQIAVGFKDAFKVFFVLDEQLFPIIDQVVKMCFGLAYSPGGRYLAANNGGTVFILSPYNLSIVASYASHSAPVHSIVWNSSETLLTSCCFGGSVTVWDLQKCELRGPSPSRGGKLISACYDEDFDMYIVLTSEGICRIHIENCSRTFILPTNNFHYTALLLVKELGLLFLGTSAGILRVALWPTLPNIDTESFDFQDVKIHSKDINRIEASIPHEELVTVSADGSIFLHSLRVLQAGARISLSKAILREANPHQSLMQYTTPDSKVFSQLALVKRDKLDILTARIKEQEDGISTLKSQHRYNLERVEAECKDEMEKLRADYEDKLRFEGEYIARLKKDMESRETEYKLSLASVKSQHEVELDEMARKHDLQQTDHQDRYDALRDEMEELKVMYAKEVETLISMHKEVKANIEKDCQDTVNKVNEAYRTLWETMKAQSREYESGLQMSEKEYEEELAKEKERLSKTLSETQHQVKELKLINTKLVGEKEKLEKRDQELTKMNGDLEEMNRTARAENEELKWKAVKMQDQLVEREDVIKKKENTIKELRSFNIHLQNFRFVLDQKIKALKDDRGPMGEQMTNLQGHIRNMYSELLEEFENTKSSSTLAAELKAKNRSLSELNSQLRRDIVLAKRKVALIQSDLVQLVRITNKDSLLFGLKQLIDKHLSMDELVRGSEGELTRPDSMSVEEANLAKVKQEVMYQHDLMKEQLMAIQRKTKTLETKSSSEVQRKMQENAALIKECNLLRNENARLLRENGGLRDRSGAAKTQGSATGALALPKVVHLKDTPYQQLKKAGSAADLHREDKRVTLPKDKLPPPSQMRPELRIKTLISELEKNQNEIIEQNSQFKKLQEQVSTFLYQPDSLRPPDSESEAPSTPFRLREVSPKSGQLSHSATQPVLGAGETSQKPEATTVLEFK